MRTLGRTDLSVHRLGLSATYRPGSRTVLRAIDEGINFLFFFHVDTHMTRALRRLPPSRKDGLVLASGAYNLVFAHGDFRRSLDRSLRATGTERLDLFLFLGILKPKEFPPALRAELRRVREDGRVRYVGVSCHDRAFARVLADEGLDVLMVRYNAAHRGAEQDLFPHLPEPRPGVIAYTGTCWTKLLRRPKGLPETEPVPTAGACYRFQLADPRVDVALTAPKNEVELLENLAEVRRGPPDEDEKRWMRRVGDAVYAKKHSFFWSMFGR